MNEHNRDKVRILCKCFLKYIRPNGATANEISKFINNDKFGLGVITINSNVIHHVLMDKRRNNMLSGHIERSKKYKSGAPYVYKWVE